MQGFLMFKSDRFVLIGVAVFVVVSTIVASVVPWPGVRSASVVVQCTLPRYCSASKCMQCEYCLFASPT